MQSLSAGTWRPLRGLPDSGKPNHARQELEAFTRDLGILDEWLVKLQKEKRDGLQKAALAWDFSGLPRATILAHEIDMIGKMREAIRLVESDPGEFIRKFMS